MKKIGILFNLLILCFSSCSTNSKDFAALDQLVTRRIPWLSGKVVFERIDREKDLDVFEISTKDNKLFVSASSISAAGEALNWYLKYYAHQMVSNVGDNIQAIEKLPQVKQKERHVSWARQRYALNYCAFNYTMSFWKWENWEKELDWMALNGVNMSLAIVGTEEVWYNVMKRLSFSEKEIDDFIPGPAYTAWWLMGNLEGWGGPMPASMRKDKVELQKRILQHMKELGIQPELHGFYGMVPRAFKQRFPTANVVLQGSWAGGFERSAILSPTDSMFSVVGDIYYEELKKLYGNDIKYFGGDPFHEGGQTAGIDVTQAGKNIQQLMQKHYPGSTWVLMGWGGNPKKELLAGLDKEHTMVQDLFGEARNEWEKTKAFSGFPFIWNIVSNFGGKEGMFGKLERFVKEPRRAATGEYAPFFAGIGTMTEGIADNPVVYDLIYTLPWMPVTEDIDEYIKGYPLYRYGCSNAEAVKAWELFLRTAYVSHTEYQEGPTESLLCARPSHDIKSVSTWGTRKIFYDSSLFETAVKHLLDASADCKTGAGYRYDLIDAVRQVVANKSQVFHGRMKVAYETKNAEAYRKASASFLKLILLQDSLLQGDRKFMLSTWIEQARALGHEELEKNLCEKNAKMLITIWGPDNPATDLHDYSHREWNGLLSSLYYNRWKLFIDQQQKLIEGSATDQAPIDFFAIEKEWANKTGIAYNNREEPDYISLARRIYDTVVQMP